MNQRRDRLWFGEREIAEPAARTTKNQKRSRRKRNALVDRHWRRCRNARIRTPAPQLPEPQQQQRRRHRKQRQKLEPRNAL
jgi:hypothetical protein